MPLRLLHVQQKYTDSAFYLFIIIPILNLTLSHTHCYWINVLFTNTYGDNTAIYHCLLLYKKYQISLVIDLHKHQTDQFTWSDGRPTPLPKKQWHFEELPLSVNTIDCAIFFSPPAPLPSASKQPFCCIPQKGKQLNLQYVCLHHCHLYHESTQTGRMPQSPLNIQWIDFYVCMCVKGENNEVHQ